MDLDRSNIDFGWTTGNNTALSHQRLIDSGAYADVHQVFLRTLLELTICKAA